VTDPRVEAALGATPPEIPAAEVLDVADALLIDVREQVEWDAGHAAVARLVPMALVPAQIADLPRGRRVLVICRSGNRSRSAAAAMRAAGVDAWNVSDGMQGWRAAGGPIVRSDGAAGTVI